MEQAQRKHHNVLNMKGYGKFTGPINYRPFPTMVYQPHKYKAKLPLLTQALHPHNLTSWQQASQKVVRHLPVNKGEEETQHAAVSLLMQLSRVS